MATDGGQVRDSTRVYAEANHTRTALMTTSASENTIMVSDVTSRIKSHPLYSGSRDVEVLLLTDVNGNVTSFAALKGAGQRVLAINSSGNLEWQSLKGE